MCIGESSRDTLHPSEQLFFTEAATRDLPTYEASIHRNDEIAWVVIEPRRAYGDMPRFTICRIAPCIMVMVEDRQAQRRFSSMPSVEEAMAFACRTAQEALLARHNGHPAPAMTQ